MGIEGIYLHSYRYLWAERAKTAGYPERYAPLALAHNSKAVRRAYAKKATVLLPPLEEYERKIIQFKGTAKATDAATEELDKAAEVLKLFKRGTGILWPAPMDLSTGCRSRVNFLDRSK